MLTFAILYFAIMIDAGLFDPVVTQLVKIVDGDPVKVVVGTAVLALIVSLDGDGSTTYMITAAAMLPLYRRLGIRPLVLACVTMLAGGVMNILPWGGPTARAATALTVDASVLFVPMIPSMLVAATWVIYAAYHMGRNERSRIVAVGVQHFVEDTALVDPAASAVETSRPGIFTGILSGTKMVDAMADSVVHVIPTSLGPYLSIVTAVLSIPFTFFISNDAFYYGILPILAKAGQAYA